MPSYIVEPNPPNLTPSPEELQELTREMTNPNQILRDIKALEAALPGAKLRGIVLSYMERRELEHFIGRTGPDGQTLFGLPILERSSKP